MPLTSLSHPNPSLGANRKAGTPGFEIPRGSKPLKHMAGRNPAEKAYLPESV
jgi:hypothetical protein